MQRIPLGFTFWTRKKRYLICNFASNFTEDFMEVNEKFPMNKMLATLFMRLTVIDSLEIIIFQRTFLGDGECPVICDLRCKI